MNNICTVTRVDPNGENGQGLKPTVHDDSDTPVDGAQNPTAHVAYSYRDGHFNSGVWACDAGTLKIKNLALHELCVLIEGTVEITNEDGSTEIFNAGDAFVLTKGFSGTWYMPVPIRKYNAMYYG